MKIIVVHGDDWSGFYFDGILKNEGHSIRYDELIDSLIASKEIVTEFEKKFVDGEWLGEQGSLPKYFKDIPEDVKY